MQLLATRGYAALVPDAPQGIVTPMADLAKAILPGVNKAIEMGIADPDRLGVMGHSYGGYSTLSLLVQTQRFRAAISSAAPANWFTLYGELSPTGDAWGIGVTEDGQGLMRSTPWERRDKYIENSPYFYLDRVQTPLLLMQGTADEGVYPNNSDEIFVGLRRLGKSAVYLKYKDEGHFLSKYENRLDYLNRAIAWFETYLKPESSAGLTRHDTLLSR
jgi:dipeptidyl aminopeptidase/acylaminoacyl peptidase